MRQSAARETRERSRRSPGAVSAFEADFFRLVLEANSEAVLVFEASANTQRVLYTNTAFEQRTGHSASEARGCDWRLLCGHELDDPALRTLNTAVNAGGAARALIRSRCRDGSEFWNEMLVAPLPDTGQDARRYVATLRDVSKEREQYDALSHRALHDALTGLPNRYLLQDRLEQAVAHARSRGHSFAVVVADLNGFKQVNDRLGHAGGDELLLKVARRFARALRAGDTVARLGGDEFALLLQPVWDCKSVPQTLRRILSLEQRPITVSGHSISISCSIGVSLYPDDGIDGDSLLRKADRAMYREKSRKRPD